MSPHTHILCTEGYPSLQVSFDHSSDECLHEFLAAGAEHFLAGQRARAKNSVMNALFPKGIVFAIMGDGSQAYISLTQ